MREKQDININIKVSKSFKKQLKEKAEEFGLKIGPYIKMILTKEFKKDKK